jgi:uncharacterized membrane protein HdeD (DUF308 family)
MMKFKRNIKNRVENTKAVKLSWIQSITSMVVGLTVLGIPYYYIEKYLYVIGLYIIILGLTETIYEVCKSDNRKN